MRIYAIINSLTPQQQVGIKKNLFALERATHQLKDIAVKVIEGQGASLKPREPEERPTQK